MCLGQSIINRYLPMPAKVVASFDCPQSLVFGYLSKCYVSKCSVLMGSDGVITCTILGDTLPRVSL